MDITLNENNWAYSDTVHFNGIPCEVYFGVDIWLDKQGKTTSDYVESEEFQMLSRAGIEVHGGAFG